MSRPSVTFSLAACAWNLSPQSSNKANRRLSSASPLFSHPLPTNLLCTSSISCSFSLVIRSISSRWRAFISLNSVFSRLLSSSVVTSLIYEEKNRKHSHSIPVSRQIAATAISWLGDTELVPTCQQIPAELYLQLFLFLLAAVLSLYRCLPFRHLSASTSFLSAHFLHLPRINEPAKFNSKIRILLQCSLKCHPSVRPTPQRVARRGRLKSTLMAAN